MKVPKLKSILALNVFFFICGQLLANVTIEPMANYGTPSGVKIGSNTISLKQYLGGVVFQESGSFYEKSADSSVKIKTYQLFKAMMTCAGSKLKSRFKTDDVPDVTLCNNTNFQVYSGVYWDTLGSTTDDKAKNIKEYVVDPTTPEVIVFNNAVISPEYYSASTNYQAPEGRVTSGSGSYDRVTSGLSFTKDSGDPFLIGKPYYNMATGTKGPGLTIHSFEPPFQRILRPFTSSPPLPKQPNRHHNRRRLHPEYSATCVRLCVPPTSTK